MPTDKKTTGNQAATSASKTLNSKDTATKTKKSSASALSQSGNAKRATKAKAATAASRVLQDGRTSRDSKSAAGSTLSQTSKRKK